MLWDTWFIIRGPIGPDLSVIENTTKNALSGHFVATYSSRIYQEFWNYITQEMKYNFLFKDFIETFTQSHLKIYALRCVKSSLLKTQNSSDKVLKIYALFSFCSDKKRRQTKLGKCFNFTYSSCKSIAKKNVFFGKF